MADLLVDTDVCIHHLEGWRRLPRSAGRLSYSVVTRAELLAGAGAGGGEATVRRLLAGMDELVVDRRIAERAGRIRRDRPSVRMADALIAATALVHSLTLVTKKVKEFKGIEGVRVQERV